MLSRPFVLFERVEVPARVSAGPPIVPSTARTTAQNFQAPAKLNIDYILFNIEGPSPSGIVNPSNITVDIIDKYRRKWLHNPVPLENLNNVIRQRSEVNKMGVLQSHQINANDSWQPPAGKYVMVTDSNMVQFQMNTAAGMVGSAEVSGVYAFDGTNNFQITNTDAQVAHKVYYRAIEQYEAGEFWFAKPFELQRTHSISLKIRNRMSVDSKFHITFQAVGKKSNRIFILEQAIDIPAGQNRVFSGLGLNVTDEEAILIKQMGFMVLESHGAFDPRYIDILIEPSQGGMWMRDNVPLITFTNVRGPYVNAIFEPLKDMELDFNDYLIFEFNNYDAEDRTVLVAIVGHTNE